MQGSPGTRHARAYRAVNIADYAARRKFIVSAG
jgi:hypothetical protein